MRARPTRLNGATGIARLASTRCGRREFVDRVRRLFSGGKSEGAERTDPKRSESRWLSRSQRTPRAGRHTADATGGVRRILGSATACGAGRQSRRRAARGRTALRPSRGRRGLARRRRRRCGPTGTVGPARASCPAEAVPGPVLMQASKLRIVAGPGVWWLISPPAVPRRGSCRRAAGACRRAGRGGRSCRGAQAGSARAPGLRTPALPAAGRSAHLDQVALR